MHVMVGERYRITTDRHNWAFQELKGLDKHGKENWDSWGYWGSLEQMAKALPNRFLMRLDGDVSEVMPQYRRMVNDLLAALGEAVELINARLADLKEAV